MDNHETKFRSMVENMEDLIFTLDLDLQTTYVSPSVEKILGYSPEERMRQRPDEQLTPESFKRAVQKLALELEREKDPSTDPDRSVILELEFYHRDGSTRILETVFRGLRDRQGKMVGIQGLSRDISRRKRTEEALRESEERYRAIFEQAVEGFFQSTPAGRFIKVNQALARMCGYDSPEEMMAAITDIAGQHYASPEDREVFNRLLRAQGVVENFEHKTLRKDGSTFWTSVSARVVRDEEGRTLYYEGTHEDIDKRKKTEILLADAEEQYRSLFETSTSSILIVNREGRITMVNAAGISLLEASQAGDLIGRTYLDLVHPEDRALSLERIEKIFQTALSGPPGGHYGQTAVLPREHRMITLQGNTIYVESTGVAIHHKGKVFIQGISKDITRTKALEAQFRQVQKMEAIGTLAGGVAHDFNNLLQVIGGYAQLLLWNKSPKDPGHQELLEIQKAVQRASQLIGQLLTFSRKVEGKRRSLDLNREILEAEKVLKVTIPKMIGIDLHLGSRLEAVNADPVQIEQILLNLGSNAADAMPDGGRLILETRNAFLDEEFCRHHLGATPGNYVLLNVADTGQGMDRETVQHIFEPFFTTKELGKGTGLGLASVYGIVKSHGGYILCESAPGQGTSFSIYLPAVQEKGARLEKKAGETSLKGGSETILVVDDEAAVRELAGQILRRHGYQVAAADCGEAALEWFQARPGGIDLVILDLGMPGMGGLNCLREFLKKDPSIRVLIASGYSVHGPVKEGLESGAAGYIGKPYRLQDLLAKVRTVLDGA